MRLLIGLTLLSSSALALNHGLEEGSSKLTKIKDGIAIKESVSPDKLYKFFGGTVDEMKNSINPQVMCHLDEQEFTVLRNQTLYKLENMFRSQNFSNLASITTKNFQTSDFLKLAKNANSIGKRDNIEQFSWSTSQKLLKGISATGSIENYLGSFSKVDDFELKTLKYLSYKNDRDPKTLKMQNVTVISRYDLRGVTNKSERRNDRGFIQFTIVNENNNWKIDKAQVLSGETLTAKTSSFVEKTKEFGLASIPQYTRNEAIRRGGYAVGIGDYNGDGYQDMYVGAWGKGRLLKGSKSGKFTEVKDSGLEGDTLVKTAIFGDFFNKGRQDLLLVRFVPTNLNGTKSDTQKFSDIVFYENLGNGKFTKKASPVKNRVVASNAMPGAASDLNGDGFLDFYVGFPGSLDFTFIGDASNVMQGAKVQGLFLNDRKKNFVDTTNTSLYNEQSEAQGLFPHSALSVDYDQDNDMDIIILDDRGNLSPIYKNIGGGKFVEVASNTGMTNNDLAMGAAGGDLDNDGILDFAITNVNFSAAQRWQESCAANWHVKKETMGNNGLRSYKGAGEGNFFETTKISGLEWAGEGMAGVEFIDYNNDGLLDIYVANGLWTGTDRQQDLSSVFFRSLVEQKHHMIDQMYFGETESDFMRVLNSYVGDIHGVNKNLKERPSMAGYQRNRLFRNDGNNKFTEVGYLEGVDSIADGYVIAKADINKDGKMDLILRNGDPGVKEVSYPAVQVFMNQSKDQNSLLVELEGTSSNRDAIGSFVEVETKDKKILRHMIANNGTAQSQKVLHFGLGNERLVKKLTVTWPDGSKQYLSNIKKSHIRIKQQKQSNLVSQ